MVVSALDVVDGADRPRLSGIRRGRAWDDFLPRPAAKSSSTAKSRPTLPDGLWFTVALAGTAEAPYLGFPYETSRHPNAPGGWMRVAGSVRAWQRA